MEAKKKNNFNQAGYITAYALAAVAVVMTLLGGLLVFVSSSQRRSSDEISRQSALQLAESGIYFYRWYLAHNLDGKNAAEIRSFWESGNAYGLNEPFEQEVADKDGTLLGRYRIETEVPGLDSTIVNVTSTGWTYQHPDIQRAVRVRFRRPSWSEYSVLANDVMRFGEDTYVTGPIHSNNGIRFDGVANNLVTSSVESYRDPDTNSTKPGVWTAQPDESQVFLAGYDFPVAPIDFNGVTSDLSLMKTEAEEEGLYFDSGSYGYEVCGWVRYSTRPRWRYECWEESVPIEGYHFTLRTDDRIEVRKVITGGSSTYYIYDETTAEIHDLPENGLIVAANDVWVDGQINSAKVTIAAANLENSEEENIYINNDLLYTNRDGSDIIGLIAEGDISVGLYSEDDLEIDAALLAQNGRIGRDYYVFSDSHTHYKRNEITVYGSMATNQRYGFSWVCGSNDEWCSGYDVRNLYFDNNLLYFPPPFFPTGTAYELDLWEDL